MQIAICDDEPVYLQALQDFVERWINKNPQKHVIKTHSFSSSEDLLEQWKNGVTFDILFLDIQIPNEMTGLDVAREIRKNNEQVIIVFVSNYSKYVYSGYEVNALRYLRKPFNAKQVEECLDTAYKRWRLTDDNVIVINVNKEKILIPHREILYIESLGHYARLKDIYGKEYCFMSSISDVIKKLPDETFVLCHRSFIVNLIHIRKLKKSAITLSNGYDIPIGIKQKANVVNKFMMYFQGDII